jgi:two-component system, cell cycle response regulator DivK
MRSIVARCLIVDDNRDSREGSAEYLEAFGFEVEQASGGEEALACLRRRVPEVVLVDLQMPGLDGWELLKLVRSDPALRDVPVIAISACVFPQDRARAREAGCDLFLSKPCLPGDMLRAVRRVLRRGHRSSAPKAPPR